MAVAPASRTRIGRLERPALTGVLVREVVNFSSYWRSATFSSTVEPTIYLLAFGFGFGALVSKVGGYDYVEFVGTGTVATAVLFSSAFAAMFGTFVKYQFQRTYDAILAAPVDTEELVTAEALWMATRASVYGCVPMLVAIAFGLDPSWGMLTVPLIAWLAGFGWATFGIMVAGFAKSIENFSYVVSAVLTPLFLVAGTFFPIDNLPELGAVPRDPQPAVPLRRARAPRSLRVRGVGGHRARGCAARVRDRDVAARHPRDDAQAGRLGLGRLVAADEGAQALVLLAARGAAGEMRAQPGNGGVGVFAGELELDVAVELVEADIATDLRLGGAEHAAECTVAVRTFGHVVSSSSVPTESPHASRCLRSFWRASCSDL